MQSLYDFPTVKKYLNRIDAEPRSLMAAVVKQAHGDGYWTDIALIKFTKQGEVTAPEGYQPNEDEKSGIKHEMSTAQWPEPVFIDLADKDCPKEAAWFKDQDGNIIMGQVRGTDDKGNKTFFPVTKWSDGEYRWMEPDGDLPLYGLDRIKDHTTVFIHEGVKGADVCHEVATGKREHPWRDELGNAAHLGWCGGALNPSRTDWTILKRMGVTRAYIVADNDGPGISAVNKISKELHCITMAIQFSDDFPKGFDLGDEFPAKMFKSIGDRTYYKGPAFQHCVTPATYMTHMVPMVFTDAKGNDKVKAVPVLRHHAKDLWVYLDELDLYVNTEAPDIVRREKPLDAMLRPFSDVKATHDLILGSYSGRAQKLFYNPAKRGRRVLSEGVTGINTYIPPAIKPAPGDITPFMDYMRYLVPVENDRNHLLRWVATVIARPDIRPKFGVLMVSQVQGTGKSTLGEEILSPLVGFHNTSFPSETDIVDSSFNTWNAKKRLAVVHEIYAGHSFKAANRLKSVITDRYATINEKYLPHMTMENFICVYACSNSESAIHIEDEDRRWLIPAVSETKWSTVEFGRFFDWLHSGGLNIILHWANTCNNYLLQGEAAPMTDRKGSYIEDSRPEAERKAQSIAIKMRMHDGPLSVGFVDIKNWIIDSASGRVHNNDLKFTKIKKNMLSEGIVFLDEVRYVNNEQQKIAVNAAGVVELSGKEGKDVLTTIKAMNMMPYKLMNEDGDSM